MNDPFFNSNPKGKEEKEGKEETVGIFTAKSNRRIYREVK
jgi:hypothetical protein